VYRAREGRAGEREYGPSSTADMGGRGEKEGMSAGESFTPPCIATGSGLSLVLPAHWKHFPKADCGEGEEQAAGSFSGEAAWWLAGDLWKALSSGLLLLFGRFLLCKKKHLQLVGQNDFFQ